MDPQLIKNVLSLPIMILMVLVFLAIITVLITNTIYYKKLWDENGSTSISEESAKVFFFINLFLAIASGVVFFIFAYRWYKLYNLTNIEINSRFIRQPFISPIKYDSSPMKSSTPDVKNTSMFGMLEEGYPDIPTLDFDMEL